MVFPLCFGIFVSVCVNPSQSSGRWGRAGRWDRRGSGQRGVPGGRRLPLSAVNKSPATFWLNLHFLTLSKREKWRNIHQGWLFGGLWFGFFLCVLYNPCFKRELFICFQGLGSLCANPSGSRVGAVFVASPQVENRPLAGAPSSPLPCLSSFPS